MLRRFLLVLTVTWAVCCLWGGISADRGLMAKYVFIAFLPLAIVWVSRFVVFGLSRGQR